MADAGSPAGATAPVWDATSDRDPGRSALATAYLRAEVGQPASRAAMLERPTAAGFARVESPSADELGARHFRGRPADLPAPRRPGIACALT